MRTVRLALRATLAGGVMAGGLLVAAASGASAQTTTTVPPVRSIPVTGSQSATTTTTVRSTSTETAAGNDLASTGLAADMLVPFAFGLVGTGAVMQALARRRPRDAYGLL